ncbi:unnamed protein product [Trichobilharzia szidati]|nr:unnamed protein product [Trichobilharzia szidati]CAH8864095.1 unnamed protein product [Trichobilharzia szidati]
MLKLFKSLFSRLPATQNLPLSQCEKTICVSSSLDRWYVHHLRTPRVFHPSKKPILKHEDWENEPYKPKPGSQYPVSVESLRDFQSLDERCKNMFTYKFIYRRMVFEENLVKTLNELGFKPTDESLAAQVIRMTLELRYKKWRLKEHPRCVTLKRATNCLMTARWRALRLLRATNTSEFNRITSALKITRYQHIDPYRVCTNDPTAERKRSMRNEFYQRRLAKLAGLKTTLSSSEKEFYARKNSVLSSLLADLSSLVDSNDSESKKADAEKLMKELFNEVVEERKLDVLREPEEDKFLWYANEAKEREKLAVAQALKQENQQRKTRKQK